jgi:hypothetical protein
MGLAALVSGLLMAFAVEDYSRYHIPYAQMLFLEKLAGRVLLAAVLLSIIGSIGILVRLSNKTTILLGVASILASVITPIGLLALLDVSVFNVHSRTIVFIVSVALGVSLARFTHWLVHFELFPTFIEENPNHQLNDPT